MESQDTTFNYKIILAALVAVIIAILIAFYYSYAHSQKDISYLEDEKKLLVKELTLMKAETDRLSGLNEINDIELQTSKFRIQQLLDSVGRLNFNIVKLKEDRKALRILEAQFDSLKLKRLDILPLQFLFIFLLFFKTFPNFNMFVQIKCKVPIFTIVINWS